MILYMTSTPGGINRATGRPELLSNKNHFVDRLKGDWKPHSRCVLIASEPDDTKFNSAMAKTYLECFNRSGLPMDSIDVLDRREPKTVEILDRFDVVILAGGHVPTENAWFHQIRLREHLQHFRGIVIGISAGTMNCAEVVYAQPEEEGEAVNPHYQRFLEGLGLTKTKVIPHYNQTIDAVLDGKRLFQDITFPDSMGESFYCLTDGAYIRKDMKTKKEVLYGEAYLISDGEIGMISKTGGEFEIPVKRHIPKLLFWGAAVLALGALIGAVVTQRIMESD
ncbi:MAG: Type 1 glutamine amidotransferase-like domain-containing protein [Oribacterium sp.]|nr:Type 1 glutamine amidotransferase-like domain-containing protein [Oribacterium sp.]